MVMWFALSRGRALAAMSDAIAGARSFCEAVCAAHGGEVVKAEGAQAVRLLRRLGSPERAP